MAYLEFSCKNTCHLFCVQVLFPVRSAADSLMTRATKRGTLNVHMAAKGNGPALFVENL